MVDHDNIADCGLEKQGLRSRLHAGSSNREVLCLDVRICLEGVYLCVVYNYLRLKYPGLICSYDTYALTGMDAFCSG